MNCYTVLRWIVQIRFLGYDDISNIAWYNRKCYQGVWRTYSENMLCLGAKENASENSWTHMMSQISFK